MVVATFREGGILCPFRDRQERREGTVNAAAVGGAFGRLCYCRAVCGTAVVSALGVLREFVRRRRRMSLKRW